MVHDHIVIANFPDERKVRRLVDELRSLDPSGRRAIVIVAPEIDELPFQLREVHFVAGSPEEPEPLSRAAIADARAAIVLAPRAERRAADALTAAAVSLIEGMNPTVRTVVELGDTGRADLYRACRCDGAIPSEAIAARLLAQEATNPGAAAFLADMISAEGNDAFCAQPGPVAGWTFADLRLALAQGRHPIIPLGLLRDGQKLVNPPPETVIEPADCVVLLGEDEAVWQRVAGGLARPG